MGKTRYFKLGPKAFSFADYSTGLQISKNKPGNIAEEKVNQKIREANAKGHLVEIDEKEYNSLLDTLNGNLEKSKASAEDGVKKQLTDLVRTWGKEKVLALVNEMGNLGGTVKEEPKKPEVKKTEANKDPRLENLENLNKEELLKLAKDLGMKVDKAFEKMDRDDIQDEIEDFV